jgi:hypothetical protein
MSISEIVRLANSDNPESADPQSRLRLWKFVASGAVPAELVNGRYYLEATPRVLELVKRAIAPPPPRRKPEPPPRRPRGRPRLSAEADA